MKTTIFQTFKDDKNLNCESIFKNLTTQKKLDNALKKHIEKTKLAGIIGNYDVKYESFYN